MELRPQSPSADRRPLSQSLKVFVAIFGLGIAGAVFAQIQPVTTLGVYVDASTGALVPTFTDFFKNNFANLTQYVLPKTNAAISGVFVVPAGSAIAVQNGGAMSLAPGSAFFADTLTLTKNPFTEGSSFAVTSKGYVDAKAPQYADNLTALKNLPITLYVKMNAIVMASTSGDGAAGLWVWDPVSTAAVSPVVVKSNNLPSGDPGRWLKF